MTVRPYISAKVRRLVIERAKNRCEYCLLHQDDVAFRHHLDHIIPVKHGGESTADNLALACFECNRRKGSDLAAIDPVSETVVTLFNPRTQFWAEHFRLEGPRMTGLTVVGRAMVNLLQLNTSARIVQRQVLIQVGRYPLPD